MFFTISSSLCYLKNDRRARLLFLKPLHMMRRMKMFFTILSSLCYLKNDKRARRWTAWLRAPSKKHQNTFRFWGQKLQEELIFEGQLDVIAEQTNQIVKLAQQCQISRLFVRRKQRQLYEKQQQLDKQQAAQLQQQQEHEAALQKMQQQMQEMQAREQTRQEALVRKRQTQERDETDVECIICSEECGFDRLWHRFPCLHYSVCQPCFVAARAPRCLLCAPNNEAAADAAAA